jgi:hypothetical protein
MTYESSSTASDVSLVPFGLRIIRAMQPSAARDETAECVAKGWCRHHRLGRARRRRSDDALAVRPIVEAIVRHTFPRERIPFTHVVEEKPARPLPHRSTASVSRQPWSPRNGVGGPQLVPSI